MSLLIKALRQAEKQNERAAKQAGEVAIELPPEADEKTLPEKTQAHQSTPLSAALDMALETQGVSSRSPASTPSSDPFPALDPEFEPTAGQYHHDDVVEASLTQEPTEDLQNSEDLQDPSALSLEPAEPRAAAIANIGEDSDRPPEAFARHSSGPVLAPSSEAPGDADSGEIRPLTANPEPAEDPLEEAAPYLEVNAAMPVRRTVRTPMIVIAGLALAAVCIAAIVAAVVWWGGNEVYQADFDNPAALSTGNFATGDEPLSPIDLGVPVEGTTGAATSTLESAGITSGEVASVTAASTTLEQPASSQTAATPAQTADSSIEPTVKSTVTPDNSGPAASASAVRSTGNSSRGDGSSAITSGAKRPATKASTPAPAVRAQSTRSVNASVPATDARPALPAVRFVRSTLNREQPQQLLNDAYRALQNNELTRAQTAYQQALRIDRNLIDGWVGLASIAARQGNRTLASQHYQRALNIDPNDQIARTGLLALAGGNLPDESESTLRTLIGSGGQNAMAELALGNTLARQGRWAEAQQAYFNANTLQPNQPDTVFNLAVSLERIRQPRAALSYYQRSLELSTDRETLFDPAAARQRIESLRQQLGAQ